MKKLLFIPLLFFSLATYAQINLFGGIGSRVLDSATYRASSAVTNAHSNGYKDLYFNAQATTPHWDIWNGSTYDHVFSFGSGSGGAWGTITGTLSDQTDLQGALDAKEDLLETVSSSTAGGTITLDFTDDTQKIFVGSATFATGKAVAFSNDANAEVFDFHFEVTNVAGTLNFPANVQMFDEGWDVGTTTWTPPATGEYEIAGSFDGTNWRIKRIGPYDTTPTSGGGTPGGSDTQVQYNDAGAFGGEADMTYNETTNTLTVDVVAVDTEAYDASGWNADLSVPTKDAIRDEMETKQYLANSSTSLTDGASITITGLKHTLTTDEATITFTFSQTCDYQTTVVTFNAVTATWTFPANTLIKYEGVPEGDNTVTINSTSGNKILVTTYKDGSNYYVAIGDWSQ